MSDTMYFAQFYITIFLIGCAVWPLARLLFSKFADQGWFLSKILGIALLSYLVWLLGILKLLPFSFQNVLFIALMMTFASWSVSLVYARAKRRPLFAQIPWRMILVTEVLFCVAFAFWAIVRAYNPDIHGLEKFMDYGFMLSVLRADYFPPIDHFFASEGINYYYFGHHVAAVLTRISQVPPNITYNLQIAHLFALSFMGSFSIVATLVMHMREKVSKVVTVAAGILGGILTAGTGNLHTILNVTQLDSYWYATASRLIPFTINEFPLYSFVVADLHAHMNNIPHALLAIGLLVNLTLRQTPASTNTRKPFYANLRTMVSLAVLALMIGISYATNSWDFPVHLMLSGCVFLYLSWSHYQEIVADRSIRIWYMLRDTCVVSIALLGASIVVVFPFWLTVKPISDGIGIVRDLSPAKEFLTLWGMYLFVAGSFVIFIYREWIGTHLKLSHIKETIIAALAKLLNVSVQLKKDSHSTQYTAPVRTDSIALILIAMAVFLLILPEIIYVRDIYTPDYYRANTMFKLYYAAWIIISVASAYGFMRMAAAIKQHSLSILWRLNVIFSYILIAATILYPYMAIKTVTDSFRTYKGLDGTVYLAELLPDDYATINWINENIQGQPVVLEAVGDSYTDYARIAANTGLPTVLGWPVHEWLWRGTYGEPVQPPSRVQEIYGSDTVAQRVEDVQAIYTSNDGDLVWQLLRKYGVDYIYISSLEHEKYGDVQTELLTSFGEIVFETDNAMLIDITL